ncbi:MAG TPA: cytochrome c oxidase subunit 3 [Stellaceae bacterium]|nr:cytochrome c oxidase subunit 3 [Stellaceae bacterium]
MNETTVVPISQTPVPSLPIGTMGRHASGWLGVWFVIATEGALFLYLLFSYFYTTAQAHGPWPPDGPPSLKLSSVNTLILISSSVAFWWGERGMRGGSTRRALLGLIGAFILGTTFACLQLVEWHNQPFSFSTHLYGSLFFTITGFHFAHVMVGLIVLAALATWTALGYFDRIRHAPISIGGLYWHFVDAVWIAVFSSLYLTPRLS